MCQSNGCSTTSHISIRLLPRRFLGSRRESSLGDLRGSPYEATPVEGGYRVTGKWRFMSGSQNATWLVCASAGWRAPRKRRPSLYPKSSATFHDIWHTLGLRGTASNEYSVEQSVSFRTSAPSIATIRATAGATVPLYRFTSNQLYSIGFGGVALGIARGTMDAFLALPREKDSPWRGQTDGGEQRRPVARGAVRGEVAVRALFLHAAADEALENDRGARRDDLDQRTRLRSPPPGPFSRHGRSSIRCFTIAARWRCSRKIRSNAVCATSTRSRKQGQGAAYCTTRRSVRSCLACRRRIFSRVGRMRWNRSRGSILIAFARAGGCLFHGARCVQVIPPGRIVF